MPDPRRFQRRRSEQSGLGLRLVIGLVAAVAIILLVKVMFRGHGAAPTTSGTNEPAITLINDVANTNAVTNANANLNVNQSTNANLNTNAATNANSNTNQPTTTSTNVKTACPKPFSQFGSAKNIALTFDLAADNANTTALLQALKDGSVPATFFISGSFAEKHADLVKTISQSFEVANHGYDVTSYASLNATQAASEISKGATALRTAMGGGAVAPYFRPPYGDTSDVLTKAATTAGYCTTLWTVDAFDWQNGQTAVAATQRVVEKFRNGAIMLLHAGYDITPDAVNAIVSAGKDAGYTFVNMSHLVGVGTQ